MPTFEPSCLVTNSSSAIASSGVMHRDDRGRRHAVLELLEIARRHDVVGADHGAAGRVVHDARQPQPGGRIDDREIGADLVEPLIQQMRDHRRGAVVGVAGLAGPEAGHRYAPPLALGDAQHQRVAGRRHRLEEPVGREVAAHLAHLLGEDRIVLDPMAVAVNDRVVQLGANFGWGVIGRDRS